MFHGRTYWCHEDGFFTSLCIIQMVVNTEAARVEMYKLQ